MGTIRSMILVLRRIPKLIWLGLFALIPTILAGAIWTGLLVANLLAQFTNSLGYICDGRPALVHVEIPQWTFRA